jgi:hypothetical protein
MGSVHVPSELFALSLVQHVHFARGGALGQNMIDMIDMYTA